MKLIIFILVLISIEICYCECENLSIITEKDLFQTGEKIEFYPKLSKNVNQTMEYRVENSNGTIVKKQLKTNNANKKSFTPKNPGEYVIFWKTNNCIAEKNVTVSIEKIVKETTIKNETGKEEIEFIDYFNWENRLEFFLFIENDRSYKNISIDSYIYRGSKHYSGDKNVSVELFPEGKKIVKLVLNTSEIKSGEYKIRANIGNTKIIRDVNITNNKNYEINCTKNTIIEKCTQPKIIYQSKSVKAKNLSVHLILLSSCTLTIILIWKKAF